MKKFLFLLIFIIPLQLFAQSDLGFAPIGAKWHYETRVGVTSRYHSIHEVIKDTLINGEVFSKISISGYTNLYFISGFPNPYYVRYDSNMVYWFNPNSGVSELLFNFNLNVGDTFSITPICNSGLNPKYDSITFSVNSVYYDTINGQVIKFLNTTYNPIFSCCNYTIAEYLGGINLFLPDEVFCSGGVIHYWPSKLRCYEDSTFGQYIRNSPCDIYYVGLDQKLNNNEISINPNPANNLLTLETSDLLRIVELKDLTGTTLLHHENNSNKTEIDVSEIPNGLYLISTVTSSGIRKTQKVIIQH